MQAPADPLVKRRVFGCVAVYLGGGGLYTVYQFEQGGHAERTGVLLVVAAAVVAIGIGAFAVFRPARVAGWLIHVVLVVLVVAFAALTLFWSRPELS